jgi:microsomal dipeptidase-like Zn-dependent dipeptidase
MPPLVVHLQIYPSIKTWGSASLAGRESEVPGYTGSGFAARTVSVIFLSDWLFPQGAGREGRLANVVETVHHIQLAGGEDMVAFGSAFDGRTGPPDDLREPADFPRLLTALEHAGFHRPADRAVRGT